ncbi:hypothetical protein [Mesorhizobium koreense]|jgi:hypothetical protein|uniref:hypothetical protein n=1 Tax=Mesorhizobium koreense TaxID=3074855 RepID=UPI00287BBDF1|nr:hypothetical protein [Mesorhizobium sp. WR6]
MADAEASVTPIDQARRLNDAVREVKNAAADRDDVVVEIREASRVRLELLAQELQPVFDAVPADNDWFDFAISSGLQPRLWIDAISHVTLARDRRTYRFLADTRLGRTVLAEAPEIKPVADQVTRYIAERMVERQRLVEGTVEPVARLAERAKWGSVYRPRRGWRAFLHGALLVIAGALVGLAFAAAFFWDRLAELGIGF